MTTLKKLLFIPALISGTLAHAVSLDGFDTNLLSPYIEKAQDAFYRVDGTIHLLDHGYNEINITPNKSLAKKLYPLHKAILKSIKKDLKSTAQRNKSSNPQAHQLYKAFKHWVYRPWKKRVKELYQESKKINKADAWQWIDDYKLIVENK